MAHIDSDHTALATVDCPQWRRHHSVLLKPAAQVNFKTGRAVLTGWQQNREAEQYLPSGQLGWLEDLHIWMVALLVGFLVS
jgi:hypothetical protein